MKEKLTSRKLILTIVSVITTICMGLGYDLPPTLTAELSAGITAVYVLVEGLRDAITAWKK